MKDNKSHRRTPAGNDNEAKSVERSFFSDLIMGLQFYSRFPVGKGEYETPEISKIALALPFVSFIIGLIPALILLFGSLVGLPPLFVASLAVGAGVLVTGAMSEDAIADSADGLFGGQIKEKRLEIFKDSSLGTYGVTALVLYILLRIFALSAFVAVSPFLAACLWIGVGILSRSGALFLMLKLPPARLKGASASVGQISNIAFFTGLAFALLIGFILSAPFVGIFNFLFVLAIMIAINFAWLAFCKRKIGGQTGDLIGANQALLETGILGIFLIGIV